MALGSTHTLTELSTRNISWRLKVAGAYSWQPYHLHVATVLKFGSLTLLESAGPLQACNGIALPFLRLEILYTARGFGLHVCNVYYELKINIISAKIYGFNIITSSDPSIATSPHKRCAIYTDEEKITRHYIHKFGKNNSSSISPLTFLKTLLCYFLYILNFITCNF